MEKRFLRLPLEDDERQVRVSTMLDNFNCPIKVGAVSFKNCLDVKYCTYRTGIYSVKCYKNANIEQRSKRYETHWINKVGEFPSPSPASTNRRLGRKRRWKEGGREEGTRRKS